MALKASRASRSRLAWKERDKRAAAQKETVRMVRRGVREYHKSGREATAVAVAFARASVGNSAGSAVKS